MGSGKVALMKRGFGRANAHRFTKRRNAFVKVYNVVSILSLHLRCMQLLQTLCLNYCRLPNLRIVAGTAAREKLPRHLPCGFLLNTEGDLLVANHQTEIAIVEKKPVRQSCSRNFVWK
jgi:hypothetical protein